MKNVRRCRRPATLMLALLLAACAAPLPFADDPAWPRAELLLLGEQHDARQHQQLAARTVSALADQGRLAAVALEMAERGRSTRGLSRDAGENEVRGALAWDDKAWPWAAYGPVVMAALHAGVTVHGANLSRDALRAAMRDAGVASDLDATLRERLTADVRDGHCGLLPPAQLPAMLRAQVARDRAMADTLRALAAPQRVVLLLAGANHVDATRGVPVQLRRDAHAAPWRLRGVRLAAGVGAGTLTPGFDETWATPAVQRRDACDALRRSAGATD